MVGQSYELGELAAHQFALVRILSAPDNGVGHTVCVANGLIFDASEKHAMRLNTANLDRCCGEGYRFGGVQMALIITPRAALLDSAARIKRAHPLLKCT